MNEKQESVDYSKKDGESTNEKSQSKIDSENLTSGNDATDNDSLSTGEKDNTDPFNQPPKEETEQESISEETYQNDDPFGSFFKQTFSGEGDKTSVSGNSIHNSPFNNRDVTQNTWNTYNIKLNKSETDTQSLRKDPTKKSPDINENINPYQQNEELIACKNALIDERIVIVQYQEGSGELTNSAVKNLRKLMLVNGFTLRDYDQCFDLREYYNNKEIFCYKEPTQTLLKFAKEDGSLKGITDYDNVKRIQQALKENNNNLIIVTGLDINIEAQKLGFSAPNIYVLKVGFNENDNYSNSLESTFSVKNPVPALIQFIAAFFPGLDRECFGKLIDYLLNARESAIHDKSELKDENKISLLEVWHSSGDEIIKDCKIAYGKLSDKQTGYHFIDINYENQLRQHFLESFPHFICQQLPVLTDFYFNKSQSSLYFRKAYSGYLGNLIIYRLFSIDEQWLMAKFEEYRYFKCNSHVPISYFAQLLQFLTKHRDTKNCVDQFYNTLVKRCLTHQQLWIHTIEQSESLQGFLRSNSDKNIAYLSLHNKQIPELSLFLELNDLAQATHYLIACIMELRPEYSFKLVLKLIQDYRLSRLLWSMEKKGILPIEYTRPVSLIITNQIIQWSLVQSIENYIVFCKLLSKKLNEVEKYSPKERGLKRLAYCCFLALVKEVNKVIQEEGKEYSSVQFIKKMCLSHDYQQNAEIFAQLIIHSAIKSLIIEEQENEEAYFTFWVTSLYESIAIALLYTIDEQVSESLIEERFLHFVQAVSYSVKRSERADLIRTAKAKLRPYKEHLINVKRSKDKKKKFAQNQLSGLKLYIRCLMK